MVEANGMEFEPEVKNNPNFKKGYDEAKEGKDYRNPFWGSGKLNDPNAYAFKMGWELGYFEINCVTGSEQKLKMEDVHSLTAETVIQNTEIKSSLITINPCSIEGTQVHLGVDGRFNFEIYEPYEIVERCNALQNGDVVYTLRLKRKVNK